MIRCVKRQQILNAAQNRKPGYLEEAERRKQPGNDPELYCFAEEDFMFLRQNYSDTKMPSMFQMAKNAASAIRGELKNVAAGGQQISREEVENRMKICDGCEFFTPNIPELSEAEKNDRRCVKCGCYMALKHRLTSSSCPVGKW